MTDTDQSTDVVAEVQAWLERNWDPDVTVAEWWERLGTAGWAAPSLPSEWHGRGLGRTDTVRVQQTIGAFGAVGPPGGLGLLLAAPTVALHGDDAQRERYIRDIVTGQQAWCQLFSEPGAGSDLAGLTTRAERDGDVWIVNGQKVWTSGAQSADMGMLLARTNPDAPKHEGISWFAFDMHQPGVEVRPLREMTGRALFNEVFLTDAVVEHSAAIGGVNNGWAVANATLAFERSGLSAGAGAIVWSASPGTIVGDLGRRVGDFVGGPRSVAASAGQSNGDLYLDLARRNGMIDDPTVRQELVRLHTLNEIARQTLFRSRALQAIGGEIPGLGNIGKLSMSRVLRQSRDLGLRLLGPYGTLHAYDEEQLVELAASVDEPAVSAITEAALFAQGPPIYGGTDQIQQNIIGERVLGLPREPNPFKETPFRELPKNV